MYRCFYIFRRYITPQITQEYIFLISHAFAFQYLYGDDIAVDVVY